jgi:hypothetical protein
MELRFEFQIHYGRESSIHSASVVATALCRRASSCSTHRAPRHSEAATMSFRRGPIDRRHGLGRGCGDGRGLGIGLPLGVGVGRGVEVAVAVGVGVGVGVAQGVSVYVRDWF